MSTTTGRPATELLADWIAGFVLAEGCFTTTTDRKQSMFSFQVGLGALDRGTCEMLQGFLGVGSLVFAVRRKPHYDDEVTFQVRSLRDLVEVVVPFADEHLPACHKHLQYVKWRAALLEYWERKAKRRRPCTVEGCERIRRAGGLCRQHYYRAYGR